MTKSYVWLLSAVFALTIILGVAAFYTEPKAPEYPKELTYVNGGPSTYTSEQKAIDEKYTADQKAFGDKDKVYSRNVSIVTLAAGLILFFLCFLFIQSVPFLAASLQIGGLITITYGIVRGFMSEDAKVEFISILVILAVLIFSGIYKFNKIESGKK